MRTCSIVISILALSGSALAANLPITGFTEDFNSMGTSGTTPPVGFSMKTGNSGTTNATWNGTTGIPAAGANSVASMINTAGALTASAGYPTATNNNGYNAPAYNGATPNTADRALATSPTTTTGAAIELTLTNGTGSDLGSIDLSYDIERYNVASTSNELPGYWLFYSLNGGTSWTEAVNFRSSIVTVPNTVGSSTVTGTLTFSAPVSDGSTFLIRWVDDNAAQTSPDQILGLDNVNITVPTPGATALLGLGTLVGLRRRR